MSGGPISDAHTAARRTGNSGDTVSVDEHHSRRHQHGLTPRTDQDDGHEPP
ncbi:hypothetical protein ACQPW1_37270 [Nocardia sp. CA-128927]|uniref:hypothetical protein n=1 Tax=Nocardia sp. CA-128927 TaxID=3239975 RepID=UPI003D973256